MHEICSWIASIGLAGNQSWSEPSGYRWDLPSSCQLGPPSLAACCWPGPSFILGCSLVVSTHHSERSNSRSAGQTPEETLSVLAFYKYRFLAGGVANSTWWGWNHSFYKWKGFSPISVMLTYWMNGIVSFLCVFNLCQLLKKSSVC